MNTIKRIVPILLLPIILFGCIEEDKNREESTLTVITGSVSNMEVYPDTKEFTLKIIDFRGERTTYIDSINSDGTFRIEFDLYKAQDIDIDPIIGKVIAHPGDSINIDIDFKDIANITFSGDSKNSNIGLNSYLNSNYSLFNFNNRSKDLSTHKYFCDSVKSVADSKRDEFIGEFNPTSEIVNWTRDYINFKYQQSLFSFPPYLVYMSKTKYQDLDTPNGYYNFLENIDSSFSDSTLNTNIYGVLGSYMGHFSQTTIQDTTLNGEEYMLTLIDKLQEDREDSFFKQMLIANLFYYNLNINNLDFFTNNRAILEKEVRESSIKTPLLNYYEDLKRQFDNPEIKSNATFAKLNGTSVKPIIDTILSENRGKVIYIDFWATWCGPCKAEMPNSKRLKQKLEGEDIEFVYICMSSKKEDWELKLSELQLEGKHYLFDSEQSRSIQSGFEISGIPHYMLINRKGHITESGGYLRPMNPETINKIEKLLHEE